MEAGRSARRSWKNHRYGQRRPPASAWAYCEQKNAKQQKMKEK